MAGEEQHAHTVGAIARLRGRPRKEPSTAASFGRWRAYIEMPQATTRRLPRYIALLTEASRARSTRQRRTPQAKTPAQQQTIIARWHTHARSLTDSVIAEAEQKSTRFRTNAGSSITALDSLTKGTAPQAPALPQSGGKGIAVPVGKTGSELPDEGDPGETGADDDGSGTNAAGGATAAGQTSGKGHDKWVKNAGTDGTPSGAPDATALPPGPFPERASRR